MIPKRKHKITFLHMPIYYFTVDYTKEKLSGKKSRILISDENYEFACKKLHDRLRKRKYYTGNLDDYNITFDWIEGWEDRQGIPLN